ncbi:hypothetical protein FB451DRAFT_1519400 [Mycena latifolia]|nr:hypothetical protein FB451DRAFT_1519400 [Mycena latifolia]
MNGWFAIVLCGARASLALDNERPRYLNPGSLGGVNAFTAFALGAWILQPIGALGRAWQETGRRRCASYLTATLINADYDLNEMLSFIGPSEISAPLRSGSFLSYTAYPGKIVGILPDALEDSPLRSGSALHPMSPP